MTELDKEEYWDVMRRAVLALGGSMDRDEFEKHWDDFCEIKRRKEMH